MGTRFPTAISSRICNGRYSARVLKRDGVFAALLHSQKCSKMVFRNGVLLNIGAFQALTQDHSTSLLRTDKKRLNYGRDTLRSCNSEMLAHTTTFTESEFDIIDRWKRRLRLSPSSGVAVFILGPMGAGKSTVINDEFRNHELYGRFAYVDTDEIMESLPGFKSNNVEFWYIRARRLAIFLTDWLLENKISFVAEGTCVKYDELEDYMERLLAAGYKIEVKRVCNASVDVVIERARRRLNRPIRSEIVAEIYHECLNGLNDLSHINKQKSLYKEI